MSNFCYHKQILNVENVSINNLASIYGSPFYVYSRAEIEKNWHTFNTLFGSYPHLICYAVKANSNLAVLNILAKMGSGFDIVSQGELTRVLKVGGDAKRCVFSGAAKTKSEIKYALTAGIYCFNVESAAELAMIESMASRLGKKAPISIRVNPDINVKTHEYISTGLKKNKFGVDIDSAFVLYKKAKLSKHFYIKGIDYHIGSQITDIKPFLEALDKVLLLVAKLKKNNIAIEHLDIGGGIGIKYNNESIFSIEKYITKVIAKAEGLKIIMEPGRSIVGSAGAFIVKVEILKKTVLKSFAFVDGAMNDFLRPALYGAYHKVLPVKQSSKDVATKWDVVGPICEAADFLAKDRELSLAVGDYLAIMDTGGYGFVMSSNYNSRPRVAELMVAGTKHMLVRERETIEDLFSKEYMMND